MEDALIYLKNDFKLIMELSANKQCHIHIRHFIKFYVLCKNTYENPRVMK